MTGLELAESLKRFRKKYKMSQDDMAKEMGVSRTMYQAYEGGKSAPSILVLVNLADSKKVPLDYLIGRAMLNTATQEVTGANESTGDELQEIKGRLAKLEAAVAKIAG